MPDSSIFDAEADAEARRLIARIDALSTVHDPQHGGVRVRWRRFGNGNGDTQPPLVLLHGGHGSWMHWLRNIEALSATRTLWLPDMPGFNDSDAPQRPALDPLLDALGGTLDSLIGAHREIDLGGFSFGGFVASRFALQRGDVRRLALLGSGGHGTLRRMTVEMINWRAARDRDEERAALLHNLHALMLHDEAAIDALAFVIHDISCHGTRFRSKDVSLAGGLQAALDAIEGPQLLLWGEHDVTADSRPLVAQLVAGHANRQGAVIGGVGHWVQYERADEVNARLAAFFA
ncbi:4,5:9,10-diseco-3-hydroxy-5,9, 17-trioxoandrosta-1(10),2-diene-4-oate hydrolase [Variovorax sp. SRS16]|uniref:alpha/beta fold hydrolase n=1 Tax=Variovorax sp. SRS16 TaxID=282217 RepID=UPI001316FB1F|nr:alpha/beta fold hydrolase [Variovorax sp. SRS16]VTU17793.1 4,5:9,10-diseco-3-hydroxy-5,9, 17-trioxoandrosta-1(10),2-diene-4-oate hydrolase [Variovorax sp. SRS16]